MGEYKPPRRVTTVYLVTKDSIQGRKYLFGLYGDNPDVSQMNLDEISFCQALTWTYSKSYGYI